MNKEEKRSVIIVLIIWVLMIIASFLIKNLIIIKSFCTSYLPC